MCLVAHYGYRCSACGVVWRKTAIEAGSITIGDLDGLHVIIDSNGQRIRNGEEQLWP